MTAMRGSNGPRIVLSSAAHALFDTYHFWLAWHMDPADRSKILVAPRFMPGLDPTKQDIIRRDLPGCHVLPMAPYVLEALRLRKYLALGRRGMRPPAPNEDADAPQSHCW